VSLCINCAVCRVSLERPIHYSESVVDVAMRWARWPGEFRHGNYLAVKPATVYAEIEQVVCILYYILYSFNQLRSRSHNFELSCIHYDRNFIDRMLFKASQVGR